MRSARLSLALETATLVLPEAGQIAVIRPRVGDDLSDLPQGRVLVVTGFKPDAEWFSARGYAVSTDLPPDLAAAIVCLPRSKTHARHLIAQAAAAVVAGGVVVIDGQKTDGVDALLRDLRGRVPLSEALAKAHGKLAVFPVPADLSDWLATPAQVDGFTVAAGVFSADGVDRGSAMLAAALPADLHGKVGDFGAGWGYLARAVLAHRDVRELHLVEAEKDALDCARVNIGDERAQFHWADATTFKAPKALDVIVMNPPFHTGRDADPALGMAFITAAARNLQPMGQLWLVANRHLPYDRILTSLFKDVTEIAGDSAFRVIRAALVLRAKKP